MTKRRVSIANDRVWTAGDHSLLQTLPVTVTVVSLHRLRADAKAFHESLVHRLVKERRLRRIDLPGGRRFLDRMMVNFIRHNLLNTERHHDERYSGILEAARQSSDFVVAYTVISTRILKAIAEAYPLLKDACDIQNSDGAYYVDPEDIFAPYIKDAPVT